MSGPLVEALGLSKSFLPRSSGWRGDSARVHAVNGVDLTVDAGEIVGLVGESGSGKSTLGRMLVRLIDPDEGTLRFDGTDLLSLKPRELRSFRRQFQFVFQDPYGSLNPRMKIGSAIGEPFIVHGLAENRADRLAKVAELLRLVGLDPSAMDRYPHEFSGGQRQRIGIARAIACSPKFIVADEPVSALDPPVQAQIVNLMLDLQDRLGLAYLFVAHDLTVVRQISDRVMVMYLGRIVEEATADELYESPRHPYTQALLASTPRLEPGPPTPPALSGEPASATDLPDGCPFHPRCPVAEPECSQRRPELLPIGPAHKVACHLIEAKP